MITLKPTKIKTVESAYSVDPDEVAHNDPPLQDLLFALWSLNSQYDIA